MAEKGPKGFTLTEAARRAGVSAAAPYRHFADKAALLATVAEQGFRDLHAEMTAAADTAPDPKSRVVELGRAYVHWAIAHPDHYRVMFGAELSKADHPDLAVAGEQAFGDLLDAIVTCQGRASSRVRTRVTSPRRCGRWCTASRPSRSAASYAPSASSRTRGHHRRRGGPNARRLGHIGLTARRVDLGQELLDGDRGVRRTRRTEDVESVLGERQFGIHDGLVADLAQPLDEGARLLHGHQRVVAAVQDEERGASGETWLTGEALTNGCRLVDGRCLTTDLTSNAGIIGCIASLNRVKS